MVGIPLLLQIGGMFQDAKAFNQDLNAWDVSSVTHMGNMFFDAIAFNGDVSGWDTSSVIRMWNMFYRATSFNKSLNSWNVSSVRYMGSMFQEAIVFNQPLDNWNTSFVEDMSTMFFRASAFNQPIGTWDTSSVEDMGFMFLDATSFNQDIGSWDTRRVTTMQFMFSGCVAFDQDLSRWNVEDVTEFGSMFSRVTLSHQNYDALLIGWNAQNLFPNESFGGGNSQYCSVDAENARQNMIDSDGWTISDGGACNELGIDDIIPSELISFYPNPVHTVAFLDFDTSLLIEKVEVFDILGKRLILLKKDYDQIPLASYKNGVYFVKVTADQGSRTYKVIKK